MPEPVGPSRWVLPDPALAPAGEEALAVGAEVPVKDLREFAAWVKSNPARGSVALPGVGGSMHFFTVMIGQELGVPLQIIPYKGSGVVMTAAGLGLSAWGVSAS